MSDVKVGGPPPPPPWEPGKTAVFWGTLKNFETAADPIESGDTTIRRIDEEETSLIRGLGLFTALLNDRPEEKYLVETKLEARDFDSTYGVCWIRFNRLILALRLISPGPVRISQVTAFQPDVEKSLRREWSSLLDDLGTFAEKGTYNLASGDVAMLQSIHQSLRTERDRFDGTAFRRFISARTRVDSRDKLIDYWVALESLFLPQNEAELSFRAALRIAYFLGDGPDKRSEIFDEIRDSYDLRSWLVHGETADRRSRQWTSQRIVEVVAATESHVRDTLRTCVNHPNEPDIARLDKAIILGETYVAGQGDNT